MPSISFKLIGALGLDFKLYFSALFLDGAPYLWILLALRYQLLERRYL